MPGESTPTQASSQAASAIASSSLQMQSYHCQALLHTLPDQVPCLFSRLHSMCVICTG
jgi:hypothetical protein